MSKDKNNASEKKGKNKNPNAKQQLAKLRKSVKELTARFEALESHVLNGTPIEKTVEQASIIKEEGVTLQTTSAGFDMDDHTKHLSVINVCTILPSAERDPETMMHTLANIKALVGFDVTTEMREAAYSDPKFMIHLEQFGLSRPVKE